MKSCQYCSISCEDKEDGHIKQCYVSKREGVRTYKMLDNIKNISVINIEGAKATHWGMSLRIEPNNSFDSLEWSYDDMTRQLHIHNKKKES